MLHIIIKYFSFLAHILNGQTNLTDDFSSALLSSTAVTIVCYDIKLIYWLQ